MPLDRINGEVIEAFGKHTRIAPLAKWADTAFWKAACQAAEDGFRKAGCAIAITFDEQSVLVQEYHDKDTVIFIFCRRVPVSNFKKDMWGLKELYRVVPILFTQTQRNELVMSGRWPAGAPQRSPDEKPGVVDLARSVIDEKAPSPKARRSRAAKAAKARRKAMH
jgi:hypothetical protein